MSLNKAQIQKYGVLGALAGVGTGFMLKFISQLVSNIPGVNLDLQSISISTTGLGNVVNTGLSTYAQKLLGLVSVPLTIPEWAYLAIGGAAFVILGAYIADMINMLKGSKQRQLTTIMVIAGVAVGWIMSMSVGIPALASIVTTVIDAAILSWILIFVDDSIGTKLI